MPLPVILWIFLNITAAVFILLNSIFIVIVTVSFFLNTWVILSAKHIYIMLFSKPTDRRKAFYTIQVIIPFLSKKEQFPFSLD